MRQIGIFLQKRESRVGSSFLFFACVGAARQAMWSVVEGRQLILSNHRKAALIDLRNSSCDDDDASRFSK